MNLTLKDPNLSEDTVGSQKTHHALQAVLWVDNSPEGGAVASLLKSQIQSSFVRAVSCLPLHPSLLLPHPFLCSGIPVFYGYGHQHPCFLTSG